MRLGSLQLSRRRTLRGLAGFVVMFLLAGHVLAATGLCAVTSAAPATLFDSDAVCSEHAPSDPGHAPAAKHHCPADEPTPQARSVDLPATQFVVAVAFITFHPVDLAAVRLPQAIVDHDVPPLLLYARLQRLRL